MESPWAARTGSSASIRAWVKGWSVAARSGRAAWITSLSYTLTDNKYIHIIFSCLRVQEGVLEAALAAARAVQRPEALGAGRGLCTGAVPGRPAGAGRDHRASGPCSHLAPVKTGAAGDAS